MFIKTSISAGSIAAREDKAAHMRQHKKAAAFAILRGLWSCVLNDEPIINHVRAIDAVPEKDITHDHLATIQTFVAETLIEQAKMNRYADKFHEVTGG